jgi:hypothetical protein
MGFKSFKLLFKADVSFYAFLKKNVNCKHKKMQLYEHLTNFLGFTF